MVNFKCRASASIVASLLLLSAGFSTAAVSDARSPKWMQRRQSANAPPSTEPQKPRSGAHVIMISIDGLPPEYYTQSARLGLKLPNLTRMKLNGAYADGVEGVYPTVTYPSHSTMITGARPATHGIVQNRIFEPPPAVPTRDWYWFASSLKCETLWSVARKAGLITGNVGWPVTAGADIDYNVPEIWDPNDRKARTRTAEHSTPGLLEKAAAAVPTEDSTIDGRRTALSEYIITTHRPNVMLIHLVDLDDAHHTNGPRSAPALPVAERLDGYVGRIVEATRKAGILDKTTFLIVSDHGFASVEKRFEPGVVLVKEKLITLDPATGRPKEWKAYPWNASGSCAIVLRDPADSETAARVADIFGRIAKKSGGPLYRVLGRADLDRLGAIPQAALMLDAGNGFAFGDAFDGPEIHPTKDYRGTHGQLPSRHELRSSLIVFGEAARVGARVGLARMIDIGPTAAAMLGLVLPNAEGLAIRELLRSDLPIPAMPKKSREKDKSQPAKPEARRE